MLIILFIFAHCLTNLITFMEKVFDFIRSLDPVFYDVFGYPTIKMYSDYFEVYFDVYSTIKSFKMLDKPCDEFRMYSGDGCITVVYTFYNLPFEE